MRTCDNAPKGAFLAKYVVTFRVAVFELFSRVRVNVLRFVLPEQEKSVFTENQRFCKRKKRNYARFCYNLQLHLRIVAQNLSKLLAICRR